MNNYNLISLGGILGFLFLAWIFSKNRRNLNLRIIIWGIFLQFLFALFIFRLPVGLWFFEWMNVAVVKLLSFAKGGIYFVFGPLALSPGESGPLAEQSIGFILAFQALPAAVFFSALMALLYYLGIMQKIIRIFSYIFTRLMKISGAESLCVASNIMVGVESAFTVRPYIEKMTRSELCTILTAGMATIASTVMAIYVGFLYEVFPNIAGHLVSASILSAPAAIVMSKLIYPEDDNPQTLGRVVEGDYHRTSSWVESIIIGSIEGVKLCVGIVALLLSFLGLLAMLDWIIGLIADVSLQKILSYFYLPLTYMMGIPLADISKVADLLAARTIVTELVSYKNLSDLVSQGALVDPRSIIITTYALCGFAHIASLAIFVGGISGLVPGRAKDLAGVGFRALLAATLACLMTGAVAGVFINPHQTTLLNLAVR